MLTVREGGEGRAMLRLNSAVHTLFPPYHTLATPCPHPVHTLQSTVRPCPRTPSLPKCHTRRLMTAGFRCVCGFHASFHPNCATGRGMWLLQILNSWPTRASDVAHLQVEANGTIPVSFKFGPDFAVHQWGGKLTDFTESVRGAEWSGWDR